MEMGYSSVINRLKWYRKELNKTQDSMSQMFEVGQAHYSKLEDGKKIISYHSLEMFEKNGGDIQFLITGEKYEQGRIDQYLAQCRTENGKKELLKLLFWVSRQGEALGSQERKLLTKKTSASIALIEYMEKDMSIWKSIRLLEKLTQIQMADILDINIKRYRRIEKMQSKPDAEILYTAYEKLGYSPLIIMKQEYYYLRELNTVWDKFSEKTIRKLDEIVRQGITLIQESE